MDENIREALADEILSELNGLNELEIGSKEHQVAVDAVTKLYRLGLEDVRNDTDYDEKVARREMDKKASEREQETQNKQEKGQRIERWARFGLEAAGIVLPLMFYRSWMKRGFKFEETGTFTSSTFRGLIHHFKPTKK